MPTTHFRLVFVFVTVLACACAKSSTAPTTGLQVRAISPNVGSTTGGTSVTITGNDFGNDAVVSIGGVAATNVVVQSPTQLAAVTPVHAAASAVDVVVTSAGNSATLAGGFGFIAPSGTNQPPVITSIRSIGSRPGQPSGFADQDETVTLVADVSDADTALSALTYVWTGPGTFTGAAPTTSWHLPATVVPTPSPVTVTLTVSETYVEGKLTHENTSTPRAFVMQVHDSQKEILDMGQDFLTLFSNSNVSTTEVLHNFSTTCDDGKGRADEQIDVDANRERYVQDFSAFRISRRGPAVIRFDSVCVLPDGRVQPNIDACASYAVHWEAIKKSSGVREITNGVDYVSAVVENNQWRLCHSSFIPSTGYPSLGLR